MTRRRRDDSDGLDGDAPWRATDYERAARPPDAAGDYNPAPRGGSAGASRPARGALGTSSGRADRPGEETGPPWERTSPPWELPGWDETASARRRPRDDNAHPSGPLPQVSSGPLPRLSPESWPSAVSGPLPPVSREAWPSDEPGHPGTRRAESRDDTSYLRTGYTDPAYAGADPGHAGIGSGYGGHTGADYAERSLPPAGLARAEYPSRGGGAGGPGYPGPDPDYDDTGYHDSFPSRGGHARDGYVPDSHAQGGDYPGYDREPEYPGEPGYPGGSGYPGEPRYPDEPGYPGESGYPGEGYHDEGDYPGGDYPAGDYPGGPGYAPEEYAPDDYAGQSGYPGGPDDGYPGQDDTGYQAADDYALGRDQAQPAHDRYGRSLRDDPDDHRYGDTGGWYGDVDEDQAWGDDEYESGLLPGFSADTDYRRARDRVPAAGRARSGRGGPDRPRGAKPKRKSAMRRTAGWIALIVLVIILAVVGGGFYYVWHNYLHPPDYSGPGTGNVTVQIKSGETATQVGQQLVNLGVVASVRAFSNAAKASGHGSSLEPGYYRLHKHMAAKLAFALLLKPSSRIQVSITIPEGLRLSSIIAILGKKTENPRGYQQAIKDTSALGLPSYAHGKPEGYLFPATYTVQPGTPPLHVLQMMVQRYDQEAASVNLAAVSAHDQITERQAIIVASLVQAEGRRSQDFPKIARVIYNRLNLGMPLQLDSTVMYALNKYGIRATAAQTKVNSLYNTYRHTGLPPGPIDSPGRTAIHAALHPTPKARGNWLYFLTVNPKTGLTKFTNSFTQFQAYEAELNANLAKGH
jgi:UPF0755 protein